MKLNQLLEKKPVKKAGEIALKQLDIIGYELSRKGVTDKINRHTIAALIVTEDQRLQGELSRLQLRIDMQRAKIENAKNKLGDIVNHAAEWSPEPLNRPLMQLKERWLT